MHGDLYIFPCMCGNHIHTHLDVEIRGLCLLRCFIDMKGAGDVSYIVEHFYLSVLTPSLTISLFLLLFFSDIYFICQPAIEWKS